MAAESGQVLPGQHQRSLRQEPQAAVDRRRRPGVRPDHPARWSYGASKAIDEFLALAYWREQRLPVVIGPVLQRGRAAADRAPTAWCCRGSSTPALAGRPLVVHDDGRQVRCFAHVPDVVAP